MPNDEKSPAITRQGRSSGCLKMVLIGILIIVYTWLVLWGVNRNPYKSGSGHYAGFEWAKKQCPETSPSFYEGCEDRKGRDASVILFLFFIPIIAAFTLGYSKRGVDTENEKVKILESRRSQREEWRKGKDERHIQHLLRMKQNKEIREEKRRSRNKGDATLK